MNGLLKMASQSPSSTLMGMSRTLKARPATPEPLLVTCPMVPVMCVPCPSMSSGRSVFQMKSRGATKRSAPPSSGAAAKGTSTWPSGGKGKMAWPVRRSVVVRNAAPVSSTATTTFDEAPWLMSHARSMSMAGKFHWRE